MSSQEALSIQPEERRSRKSLRQVGAVALQHAPERIRRAGEDIVIRRMLRSPAFNVKLLETGDAINEAIGLEQEIWHQEQYDDPQDYDYEKYTPQSRTFAAYDDEGKVIGVTRLFEGSPLLPPFLAKMPINDPELAQKLAEQAAELKAEEFGTVAVRKELRGGRIFMDFCRVAWRDAADRGVQTWGIIMEPERVEKMNSGLGFTFKQIGPAIQYQGGECAAHIMDFDEVRANMSSTKPELYDWFVNQPL
jgi:hypothetical protein